MTLKEQFKNADPVGVYIENNYGGLAILSIEDEQAIAALETYRAAIDKYNALTRGNMQRASDREGVKHYII